MHLTEQIYNEAIKQGLLSKKCEFEGKPHEQCECPLVYNRSNIAGTIIEYENK